MSSKLLYLELFSINFALFLREEAQPIVEIPVHQPEDFPAILVLPQRLHRHGARSESVSQLHQEMRVQILRGHTLSPSFFTEHTQN